MSRLQFRICSINPHVILLHVCLRLVRHCYFVLLLSVLVLIIEFIPYADSSTALLLNVPTCHDDYTQASRDNRRGQKPSSVLLNDEYEHETDHRPY